jgi:hypothetical protein
MERKYPRLGKGERMNKKCKRKSKRKILTIKIPRNKIVFKENVEYKKVSPKICHSIKIN